MSKTITYEVILARQPQKILRKLPKDVLRRIDRAIQGLAAEPRPGGCKKLTGYDNVYRIREGDWRISYAVEDDRLIVLILEISTRGSAYRNL